MTLRIGTQLVGLRADTDRTLARLRTLVAAWIDEDHPRVPWVFDVRLDPEGSADPNAARTGAAVGTAGHRGPRPVPQLRVGNVLLARSRSDADILRSLAWVLGGVRARQDETRVWSNMRPFLGHDRIVLVGAQRPAFVADPALARAGIRELPSWAVDVEDRTVRVPAPLAHLAWSAIGTDPPSTDGIGAELAGIVVLGHHDPEDGPVETGSAAMLTRLGSLHTSTAWFTTVDHLIRDGRVTESSDRGTVRDRIVELVRR